MSNAKVVLLTAALAAFGTIATAQTVVTLDDTSQSTTLTASVAEQARVTVPAGVTFNVANIASSTNATAASVTVDNIALSSADRQLKISLLADASDFTPPVTGAATWTAGDVTWNAPTWDNALGETGVLSSSSANAVATCTADVASCGTSGLVFTLAANTNVKRSGGHQLSMTWKFESILN